MTNSAWAGTRTSTVLADVIGVGFPRMTPAKPASSIPSGNGMMAERNKGRIAAERNCHAERFLSAFGFDVVKRSALLDLHVHTSRAFVVNLHPVHAHVCGRRSGDRGFAPKAT